ncbi:hypothetical protein BLA60_39890 [Actinophytocola xinjiangensis]|uniref:Uncharacterized protein n=1 Tax=Actinophytocola xinjiangensis TaxID=485602 RepID=A0A7Z0WDU9_9PSEU|nr:hypothetical protein BLA60_39890 [Actinophytocola xinjiangensis]
MGAGGGYWAAQLSAAGIPVSAYDPDPPEHQWHPVGPVVDWRPACEDSGFVAWWNLRDVAQGWVRG